MTSYNLLMIVLGVSILAIAWLPSLLEDYPLSYPILFMAAGWLLYQLPVDLPDPLPQHNPDFTTHLTELCVIVALTGTGLKIDHKFSWRGWRVPLLLVGPTMIICILLFTWAGWAWAGWSFASALLLAAGLAPTDPVLAGDVQVGDPNEGGEDTVRFALTAEAGFNDGLAFPFVYLAIALATAATSLTGPLLSWLGYDLLYRIGMGVLCGWLSGRLLSYLIFKLPKRIEIKSSSYGFVALAITLVSYGVTELLHGYGFLAVFVASITIRSYESRHEYHHYMHAFTDQTERILIALLLLLFGGAIARGLFSSLHPVDLVMGALLVLVIRPLGGWLALSRTPMRKLERWIIASFGIRGIGSIFYISFGLQEASFAEPDRIWAVTGWTILLSVFLHGTLATPVMKRLDRSKGAAVAQP